MAQAEQILPADPPEGRHRHLAGVEVPAPPAWLHELRERDLEVLRLLADGNSTAAIAEDLAYSESTIKNVIHDLVRQLGARNRAHAVAVAIRAGAI